MNPVRIIPCLDVDRGRVVKGIQFQALREVGSPAALAEEYERQGADELVFLDVSATMEARRANLEAIREVRRKLSIPMTVGGGVRSAEDARTLLEAGADKVAVNTAAVRRPELISEIAVRFGAQCAVLAIDARTHGNGGWEVVIESGRHPTGVDVSQWASRSAALGAGEILLTSWDRDGTRQGYDLPLIRAVRQAVTVPIIASGGASGPQHMVEAVRAGADAVLAASIFHERQMTIADVKRALAEAGVSVRMECRIAN